MMTMDLTTFQEKKALLKKTEKGFSKWWKLNQRYVSRKRRVSVSGENKNHNSLNSVIQKSSDTAIIII